MSPEDSRDDSRSVTVVTVGDIAGSLRLLVASAISALPISPTT
jgi:hypothetical protein